MKFWCVIFIFGSLQTTECLRIRYHPFIGRKICIKQISVRESIKKPYLETYREHLNDTFYTTEVRTRYKIEFRTTKRMERVCCSGYVEVNDKKCEPVCQPACGNGTCIGPGECECDIGYFAKHSTCENFICIPECSNDCVNGTCIAPNVCKCNDGYSLANDNFTCIPVCSTPCGTGLYCAQPDYCECLPEYEEVTDSQPVANSSISKNKVCKPLCDSKCKNGNCDTNNTCVCSDGYERDPDDIFLCTPKCKNNCTNGVCAEPNVCICPKNYTLNKLGICEPICSKPCINGTCVAPESCKCFDGFGYHEKSTYKCEPMCFMCNNGECIAPGNCKCNEGYKKYWEVCTPVCDDDCGPYGHCTKPNECTCLPGFELKNKTKERSKKIIGNMTRPMPYDISVVRMHLDPNQNYLCVPVCNPECINGFCYSSYECQCYPGYKFLPRTSLSQRNNWNHCVPVCDPNCTKHGICTAPGVCKCNEGFVLKSNETHKSLSVPEDISETGNTCVPYCKNCDNGECITPNLCRCHAGFLKIKGICEYACESDCIHGECNTESKTCKCNFGWSGKYCDKQAMCVLSVNNDDNHIKTLNIIEEYNATIEHVLTSNPRCQECIDKLNNETLCFKTHRNKKKNTSRIECLIDGDCLQLMRQHKTQAKLNKISGITIGLGILIVIGTITTYFLLQKYRKRQQNLVANDMPRTMMQALIEEREED